MTEASTSSTTSDAAPASTDGADKPAAKPSGWKAFFELIDNPVVVLVLLFGVMAILGLPVLWKSRGFSVLSKLVLSVVVTLYTALLFFLLYLVFAWCWSMIAPELGY